MSQESKSTEKPEEQHIKNKKNSWIQTAVSIFIGIVVAVLTTWYTIYINKQEVERSELERYNKVKENLISIIEEHIVNKDSIDFISLNRIINIKSKEENLYKKPNIEDILSNAEYNIINSKHLSFEKKIEYSRILSKQFKNIENDTIYAPSQNRFESEYKELLSSINDYNSSNSKEKLNVLISKYENKLKELERYREKDKENTISDYLFNNPKNIIYFLSVYLVMFILYYYFKLYRNKREYISKKKLHIYELESTLVQKRIESLIARMNEENITLEERENCNKEVNKLLNKLEYLEKHYYR